MHLKIVKEQKVFKVTIYPLSAIFFYITPIKLVCHFSHCIHFEVMLIEEFLASYKISFKAVD